MEFDAGIFLIDKPVGPSSFKIVQQVRRALGIKKVGHTGTLDPFASGLLIVCAGRPATKIISSLMDGDKGYEAQLKFGQETDTLDSEGTIISECSTNGINQQRLSACLATFQGPQLQKPPHYSAVKHKGKPLYFYARKGIHIDKPSRPITIREINSSALINDEAIVQILCSKGTYIRTLASDIGKSLGCGAYLKNLRRLTNGPFSVADAIPGTELTDLTRARELLIKYRLSIKEALSKIGHDSN